MVTSIDDHDRKIRGHLDRWPLGAWVSILREPRDWARYVRFETASSGVEQGRFQRLNGVPKLPDHGEMALPTPARQMTGGPWHDGMKYTLS